jgi:hypothetical protein
MFVRIELEQHIGETFYFGIITLGIMAFGKKRVSFPSNRGAGLLEICQCVEIPPSLMRKFRYGAVIAAVREVPQENDFNKWS